MTNGAPLLHLPLGMTHTDWLTLVHSSGSSTSCSFYPSLVHAFFYYVVFSTDLPASFGIHLHSRHLLMVNVDYLCSRDERIDEREEDLW